MIKVSKVQMIVVQIFLVSLSANAGGPEKSSAFDLCDLMMGVSIEIFDQPLRERIERGFPKGEHLELITFENFGEIRALGPVARPDGWFIRSPYGSQVVTKTSPLGQEVLRRSNVNSPARVEVMTVAQIHAGLTTHFGDYQSGSAALIDGLSVDDQMKIFRRKLAVDPKGYVLISHSHPEYDVRAPALQLTRTRELGDLDMAMGREQSMYLNVPLVIDAVSPNGYTYSAAFFKGSNVTEFAVPHNPLADPLGRSFNFKTTYVDGLPGPKPAASVPVSKVLPDWLKAARDEYLRTGVAPTDPTIRAFLEKLNKSEK